MHHYWIVSHALRLRAWRSRDLLTKMLTIKVRVTWSPWWGLEAPSTILVSPITIYTCVMRIARIVIGKPTVCMLVVMLVIVIVVVWSRCTHGCPSLIERYRSEWWHQWLLLLNLLSQSLNLLSKFLSFFLKLGVLLQKHLLIRCLLLQFLGRTWGQRPALLIDGFVLDLLIHSNVVAHTHGSCCK